MGRLGCAARLRRRGGRADSATSRSRASSRLRAWLRKRSAVMTITPSLVRRLPASSREPPRTGSGSDGERRTSNLQLHGGRDLVDVLPARTRGAHEHLLQLGRIDADAWR